MIRLSAITDGIVLLERVATWPPTARSLTSDVAPTATAARRRIAKPAATRRGIVQFIMGGGVRGLGRE